METTLTKEHRPWESQLQEPRLSLLREGPFMVDAVPEAMGEAI